MGRIHRVDPEHGLHHVYSRGTRRWTIFIDELDYQRFMSRLGVVCTRYGIQVYAFCLMGNHFHLAVHCPDGGLSAAMRDLKSHYALQHNRRHGFSGPLFEARFGSKLVTSFEYLQILVRYIHRNPGALDRALALEMYQWSSHGFYLDTSIPRPDWLDITLPRSLFGTSNEYRNFVERNLETDSVWIEQHSAVQDIAVSSLRTRPSISTVLLLVASNAGCDVGNVRPRARNGLIGLVAFIASEHGGYTSSELADACGFSTPQGLRNAKAATRRQLVADSDLQQIYEKTVTDLDG